MAELHERLAALGEGQPAEGVRTAHLIRRDPARIAFLFPGQGAQYAGMARSLYDEQPVFRQALDRCASVLDGLLERPLRDVIHPGPDTATPLDETAFTQPALFAVEYALAELWRSWGVVPDVVMGHSVGEYVAACVAGVLSLDDALRLIAERGRLMQSLPAGGAMAAIFADERTVQAVLAPHSARVAIAALNGAEQTVISGAAAAVDAICAVFGARGTRCQPLPVSHAFHSPLTDPILAAFERAAEAMRSSRRLADSCRISPGHWLMRGEVTDAWLLAPSRARAGAVRPGPADAGVARAGCLHRGGTAHDAAVARACRVR